MRWRRKRGGRKRGMRWWQFGLTGGAVLSIATTIKLIRALAGGRRGEADWSEAAGFAVEIFAMGFLCGVIVWLGNGLHYRFGLIGDALLGLVVMIVFFICCMYLFDPMMLGANFIPDGVFMLGFAVIAGLFGGVLIGRDIRKTASEQNRKTGGPN